MTPAKSPRRKVSNPIDLQNPQYYFNRSLSWLEFNKRVLHEAYDPRTPLLERLKFMAIFSSNLDEFFMVRVAGLKQQVESGIVQGGADGMPPAEQLQAVRQYLLPIVTEQHRYFDQELRALLAKEAIFLTRFNELTPEQQAYLNDYFQAQVFPVLTPLAVDPAHPFPYISSLSLNLAVLIRDPEFGQERLARVKVPNRFPRFVALPQHLHSPQGAHWLGVPLEEMIAHNLGALFPGMEIQAYFAFRITRSADLELETDKADDLLIAIEQEIRKRRFGSVVRLEVQRGIPPLLRQTLMEEMDLEEIDVYELDGLLCLNDLFAFMSLPLPHLKDSEWHPQVPPRFQRVEERESMFDTTSEITTLGTDYWEAVANELFSLIREGDILVHHPYHSFAATVQRFITLAAHDPQVLAIKMTLYRTSGDSPIVSALIKAAENGKQVAVLVELKARFDEENNILWARKLEKVGVHVVYGVPGLKTHTKTVLVVRQEAGQIRRYVHIGTGNYNPKTAGLYEDLGLFSCRDELGADLSELFNVLTGYSRQRDYRQLLVAPVTMRDRTLQLIYREIEHARNSHPGRIIAKMNAITDTQVIRALYEASQAGVEIDLIIRGMCCLRPGVPGVSDRIRVISIIGRFLEHSRIFYFGNNGEPEYYIGSADWRSRNLDRRVEAITPIQDPTIQLELKELLEIMLADNRQAWELQPDGTYQQRQPASGEPERGTHRVLMARTLKEVEASR
ncbi:MULTISPECIES: polyphosphate kinase 1 [unclassified Thermosynechococcus]|uniref:polyphosphate kinase 1 n=1 Tax=unclassified Thermosynechococcus TaxID=2622553 RepID=UPI002872B69A|nr:MULTISPECIES: polyphosphate kinase 1 [unclassified Thermosynechococcus]WNC33303.1 polyphosphate kinase 1 [Thermosynechococcus sp. PKX95]WNC35827.1 polyphosphate kinase 1 [Thermosynechococcus sp. PKX91]WNC38350.1 polyphosphate kinase 1 [Thermosynechococcus sp. WL11]WNC40869.1 polyphosphate kinase 1 [Thermosynechococcus sp. WL17]WNC43389.1 polyphosphate kinase 1 [Thermosynechococcus sp. WL15]